MDEIKKTGDVNKFQEYVNRMPEECRKNIEKCLSDYIERISKLMSSLTVIYEKDEIQWCEEPSDLAKLEYYIKKYPLPTTSEKVIDILNRHTQDNKFNWKLYYTEYDHKDVLELYDSMSLVRCNPVNGYPLLYEVLSRIIVESEYSRIQLVKKIVIISQIIFYSSQIDQYNTEFQDMVYRALVKIIYIVHNYDPAIGLSIDEY